MSVFLCTFAPMQLKPIAYFRSPLTSKFGIPRQSGVVEDLVGEIVFEKEFSSPDAIRGLEGFDYIWLIWGFSANKHASNGLTVRPPRLGGNERLGVFATRSPFRPNPIGLSCVRIATPNPVPSPVEGEGSAACGGTLEEFIDGLFEGSLLSPSPSTGEGCPKDGLGVLFPLCTHTFT